MKRKLKFEVRQETEVSVIGIVSLLKDYRLVWNINQSLKINLSKKNDLAFSPGGKQDLFFSFYHGQDLDNKLEYYLLSNGQKGSNLIAEKKEFNYFMLLQGPLMDTFAAEAISKLRQIPNLISAYIIHSSSIKSISALLEEIELHMLEENREEKKRIPYTKKNLL